MSKVKSKMMPQSKTHENHSASQTNRLLQQLILRISTKTCVPIALVIGAASFSVQAQASVICPVTSFENVLGPTSIANNVNCNIYATLDNFYSLSNYGVVSTMSSGTLNNYGTLDNHYHGFLNNNHALLNLGPSTSPDNYHGVLVNEGTLNNTAIMENYRHANLSNFNTLNNNSGGLLINDSTSVLNNASVLNNNLGATINSSYEMFNYAWHANATINNSGTLNINAGFLNNKGTLNNSGSLNNHGNLSNSGGLVNVNGSTLTNSGYLYNKGYIGNKAGSTLANHGTIQNDSQIANSGTFNNDQVLRDSSLIRNSGAFTNSSGAGIYGTGTIENTGTFINSGNMTGTGTSSFTQTAGVSQMNGLFSMGQLNIQGGQLFGTGSIIGPVLNTGGMVQGGAAGSPGKLRINGSFTQQSGGTLQELINGTGGGLYSTLAVTGTISLGGALDITSGNGYSFAAGQTFDIATFDSGGLTGTFDNLVYGSYSGTGSSLNIGGGLELDVLYNNTAGNIQLSVQAVPEPEDFFLMSAGLALVGLMGWRRKSRPREPGRRM